MNRRARILSRHAQAMLNRPLVVASSIILIVVVTATGILATTRIERHYERVGGRGGVHFVWVDWDYSADPAVYENAISDIGAGDVYEILFYSEREQEPSKYASTSTQVAAWIAKYELDHATGHETFMYVQNGAPIEPFGSTPRDATMPKLSVTTAGL